MKQLLEQQYGTNLQALLARSVQVLGPHPPASTLAPIVPGVSSPVFVSPHGVCGSQPPPFVLDDTMCGTSIMDNLSYPRVEDNSEPSSIKSLFPMQTDPPILPALPLPANLFQLLVEFSTSTQWMLQHLYSLVVILDSGILARWILQQKVIIV